MKLVPNIPGPEATGTERKVFSLLRNVDWGGTGACALHSLNLAEHEYQRWGEIDFLVVGTKGLLVIEVKGGDASCVDGQWRYEDRLGRVVRRNKSPVVQAKDAFFSLDRNYIAAGMGQSFCAQVPAGFCVVLASMLHKDLEGVLGTPELPTELVGTREDVANAATLQRFLERVANHWAAKSRSSKSIRPDDVARLITLLRPGFERVQPWALARERLGNEMLSLTEEQYSVLDLWEGADRILCSSPAGCGKTLLAAEMARRARQAGEDLLFLVGSDGLAAALKQHPGLEGIVHSIEEVEAIPPTHRPKAKLLLIDEGQQFLTRERLSLLDSLVGGGIKSGRWAWFGDANYQSSLPVDGIREGLALLSSAASVRPELKRNYRNTPEIIKSAELASGVPQGHALVKGRGMPPKMSQAVDEGSAAGLLAGQAREWLDEGVPLPGMVLLVDGHDVDGLAGRVGKIGGFSVATGIVAPSQTGVLRYAQVEDFRGLEAGFVMMCLLDAGLGDDELGRLLYLGMTRGNFALFLVALPSIMQRIHTRMASNAMKHGGTGGV